MNQFSKNEWDTIIFILFNTDIRPLFIPGFQVQLDLLFDQ